MRIFLALSPPKGTALNRKGDVLAARSVSRGVADVRVFVSVGFGLVVISGLGVNNFCDGQSPNVDIVQLGDEPKADTSGTFGAPQSSSPRSAKQPSVSELMAKFAQTQNALTSSYVSKAERKAVCTYVQGNGVQIRDVERNSTEEFRWDGDRLKIIRRRWGWVSPSSPDRSKDNKAHNSYLWDGERFYQYTKILTKDDRDPPENYAGLLFLDQRSDKDLIRRETQVVKIARTEPFSGYFHNSIKQRIDQTILGDQAAVVHDKMETVGGSQCYVISCSPEKGVKIRIWIDPEHGYNMVKYHYGAGEGYLLPNGRRFGRADFNRSWGEVLSLKKIDDLWVPMETRIEDKNKHSSGSYQHRRIHWKRTEFIPNPDHEALGSFLPDDIMNGATVKVTGVKGVKYRWLDGKLLPKSD